MKPALLYDESLRTFAVVLDTGEEAMQALASFAGEYRLKACQLSAIGAFERAVVAFFDWTTKEYDASRSMSRWRCSRWRATSRWRTTNPKSTRT